MRAHLRGLGRGRVLAGLLGGGDLLQPLLLRLLILRLVLDKHLEEFGGPVFVQRLAELVDARGHLQALDKDL